MAQQLNQVPPDLEVWKVAGQYYLVRRVTEGGQEPPLFLHWKVAPDDVEALGITAPDHTFATTAVFGRTGSLPMGGSRELLNTTEDPVDTIFSNYKTEVKVKPWLADPEILNLWIGAAMEGRSISDAELQGSEWWRSHSQAEREWISLNASDPQSANDMIQEQRIAVAQLFRQAGINNAGSQLINTIADQMTTGGWTQGYAANQIRILADPKLNGRVDPLLTDLNTGLNTTRAREDDVRATINTWLGPAYAGRFSQNAIGSWASRLREDPDAMLELEDQLKKHRLALFPEYDNPNLTYEDIAAPWRGVFQQQWGQVADETSNLFAKVVRMNDLAGAEQLLRTEGLKRNNKTVTDSLLSDLTNAFGGQVRKADAAIV